MPKTTKDRPFREHFRFSQEDKDNLEAIQRKYSLDEKTKAVSKALEELAEK